jgi:hypothetical protein
LLAIPVTSNANKAKSKSGKMVFDSEEVSVNLRRNIRLSAGLVRRKLS